MRSFIDANAETLPRIDRREPVLTYRQTNYPIHIACEIKLSKIYTPGPEWEGFEKRLNSFISSDPANRLVYKLKKDRLLYRTEHLIPTKKDKRVPLLLVFGNPASHSITAKMFFSPKEDGKENRFWKHLLRAAEIVDLALDEGLSTAERNKVRMDRLMALDYDSPFRIGLCVYFSMPSSAGGAWSGVAGIRKLLGRKAFDHLADDERVRIFNDARRFLHPGGIAVVFQKDAWNGLRSRNDPPYSIQLARKGKLRGALQDCPHLPLWGIPPTRLLGPAREVLARLIRTLKF